MKKTARITAVLLAGALALGLTACGSDTPDFSAGLDENGFYEGVKASEKVTLPEYKGIDLYKSVINVSESDIEAQIDELVGSSVFYVEITDRAVADGDTVNIDYVGSIDGVEFEGGNTGGAGTDVTIGVTQYIDDFLEQLIGRMPGETFDVNVTFPEDYGVDELNGKDAVFKTTVNYICGEEREASLDEVAQKQGFANEAELREDISDYLYYSKASQYARSLLSAAVCEKIPKKVLNSIIDSEMANLENYANQMGMAVEVYLYQNGFTSENDFIEQNTESFETEAVYVLACQAIAEREGLTVTDEDLTAAGYTNEDFEYYGKPYLKQYILISEKVPDFIVNNANIIDDIVPETVTDPDADLQEGGEVTDDQSGAEVTDPAATETDPTVENSGDTAADNSSDNADTTAASN